MIEILYSCMEFSKNCKYVFKKKSGMSGSLSAGSSNEKCSGLRQKDGWLSGPGRGDGTWLRGDRSVFEPHYFKK